MSIVIAILVASNVGLGALVCALWHRVNAAERRAYLIEMGLADA